MIFIFFSVILNPTFFSVLIILLSIFSVSSKPFASINLVILWLAKICLQVVSSGSVLDTAGSNDTVAGAKEKKSVILSLFKILIFYLS